MSHSILQSIKKYDEIVKNKLHAWEWPSGLCKHCYDSDIGIDISYGQIYMRPEGNIQYCSFNPRCRYPTGALNV